MIDLDVNVTQQSALNTKLSILYTIYRGGGTRDERGQDRRIPSVGNQSFRKRRDEDVIYYTGSCLLGR